MKFHRHMCGDVGATKPLLNLLVGCGHVFRHGTGHKDDMTKHMCPKCGKGPWVYQLQVPKKQVEVIK